MKPEQIKIDHFYRCTDGTIAKVLSISDGPRGNPPIRIVNVSLLSAKRVSERTVKWPHYRLEEFAALCLEEVVETAAAGNGGAH